MNLYCNIPVQATTNTYLVVVHTADDKKFEYLINAINAKNAQRIGYQKTFNHYANCGIKNEFKPTTINAYLQDFKMIKGF